MLRCAQPGGGIGVESLLPCTGNPVEVARRLHALGQFRSCFRAVIDLLGIFERLLRGHGPHPGLAHTGDLIHHITGQTQLRLLNAPGSAAVPCGKRQKIQQAEGQSAPKLQLIACDHALKTENGVGNPPGLRGIRRLCPTLRQKGLQGWAVHQGQLDSIFLLQRLRQQGLSGLRTLVAFIQGTSQRELAPGKTASFVVDAIDVLIQADAGTSRQHCQSECGQSQFGMSGTQRHHGFPPP